MSQPSDNSRYQNLYSRLNKLRMRLLIWRVKNLSDRAFVILLGVLVGVFTGLAASALKFLVSSLRQFLTGGFEFQYANWLYILYPLLGIILTVALTQLIFKDKSSHGITDIIKAISKGSSVISPKKLYTRLMASAVTTGFGGSVGIEAPISTTGAAFGSNLGRILRLNYKNRSLLIGCGASGAIAAMFNSPIAGVIFAIEIILTDISISSFIPLLMASVAGAVISSSISGGGALFYMNTMLDFQTDELPWFILLGVLSGGISLYFIRVNTWVEQRAQLIISPFIRAILGGLALGSFIFIFPPIYGEGYSSITSLLDNQLPALLNSSLFASDLNNQVVLLVFLVLMVFAKPIATAFTISSGGGGGVFAPSLFVGAMAGFSFAFGLNLAFPNLDLSLSAFTLVGMCGVMSGVLHAPLTAIFLIAEITGGYGLFIPLMLTSAIAYSTIYYFEKNSIYTKSLVEKGDLILDNRDLQVLSLITLNKLIEKELLTIRPDAMLEDLVSLVKKSKRNIFPVVDAAGVLKGIITLDDIREIMFDPEARKAISIESLMYNAPGYISVGETMTEVMSKFENTGAWNLPVIQDGKYIGLISKSTIFNSYRNQLQKQSKL